MLKIENLCKSFRTEDVETIALNNVSFTVEDGEFVGVSGNLVWISINLCKSIQKELFINDTP